MEAFENSFQIMRLHQIDGEEKDANQEDMGFPEPWAG